MEHRNRERPWAAGGGVGGRYRLLGKLGAGAMGEVWRAEHEALGSAVALKLVDLGGRPDADETLSRFRREARVAAQLKSPHVVQVFDYGTEGSFAYIAMELLEGESLAERLARSKKLEPLDCARVFREIALALDKAHAAGVLHRDLKPANVFLSHEHGRDVAKILDFGVAKLLDAADSGSVMTRPGVAFGTPAFMSPEQVTGSHRVDHRSDLWSTAMMAFQCVTGRLPFVADTLSELLVRISAAPLPVPSQIASVPPGFDAWFARAASRDPAQRFTSAGELTAALEQVLVGAWSEAVPTVRAASAFATGRTEVMESGPMPPAVLALEPPHPAAPAPGSGSWPSAGAALAHPVPYAAPAAAPVAPPLAPAPAHALQASGAVAWAATHGAAARPASRVPLIVAASAAFAVAVVAAAWLLLARGSAGAPPSPASPPAPAASLAPPAPPELASAHEAAREPEAEPAPDPSATPAPATKAAPLPAPATKGPPRQRDLGRTRDTLGL
jgi:serine/threonine-protein kinase